MSAAREIEELTAAGKALGLVDAELREFVAEERSALKTRADAERAERILEREAAAAEAQRVREAEERQAAQQTVEADRRAAAAAAAADHALRLAAVQLETAQARGPAEAEGERGPDAQFYKPPALKLPQFEEGRDQIDAFLERFERFVEGMHLPKAVWSLHLATVLTGKGLEAYSGLSAADASNYDTLKDTLLRRYDLNEEGYRKKFREARPEGGETAPQYLTRKQLYMDRWLELAGVNGTFAELKDFYLQDQFLRECHPDLTMYLRERLSDIDSIEMLGKVADRYTMAHHCSITSSSNANAKTHGKGTGSKGSEKHTVKGKSTRAPDDLKCYNCREVGHYSRECPKNGKTTQKSSAKPSFENRRSARDTSDIVCWICQKKGHYARDCSSKDKFAAFLKTEKAGACSVLAAKPSCPPVDEESLVSCGSCALHENILQPGGLPVCNGMIGSKRVTVLRDTGCSTAVVRRALVRAEQLTGETQRCTLVDGSTKEYETAHIQLKSPYFTGEVKAMCMHAPLYDIIIGNLEGAQDPVLGHSSERASTGNTLCESKVDKSIENPEETTDVSTETTEAEASAVVTRAGAKRAAAPVKPLKVQPSTDFGAVTTDVLKQAQVEDPTLKSCWESVGTGLEQSKRSGWQRQMLLNEGLLYRVVSGPMSSDPDVRQVVVPQTYRAGIMRLAHESIVGGHLMAKKTSDRVLANFWWPGVGADIKRHCKSCDICQRTIPQGRVTRVPMGRMPLMTAPFKRVAIDLIGPLKPISERGHMYILTMVDFATRYPEAVPLKRIDTETVAEALLGIFCRVGFPAEVLSDRGSQFTSDLMKEVCRLVSLKQVLTTPYHPQCNGLCERMNGVLKAMLRKMCEEQPKDWDRYLPAVLFAYREVPQASTGFSPFELLYGRTVRGPLKILKELWAGEAEGREEESTYQYVLDLRNRLEHTCKLARESLSQSQEVYKHHFDKKARPRKFVTGQQVLVLRPTDTNKLLLRWKGPYRVSSVVNDNDYRIQMGQKEKIFHANLLKLYVQRQDQASVIAVVEPSMEDNLCDSDITVSGDDSEQTWRDVQINPQLSCQQQAEIRSLLSEFEDVLTSRPGTTNLGEHTIVVTDQKPVNKRPYPLPYAMRDKVDKEIQKMLHEGIIERSDSPYNAPIVLVRKSDDSIRFCVDYRGLNALTQFDAEPMPCVEEIMGKLSGDRYMSKFDAAQGFWQVPMAAESKHLTAFTVPQGHFQFLRMPFGLVNSPATFNRCMRKMLTGLDNVDSFVDDLLVHNPEWAEHVRDVRANLLCCRAAGLTLKPKKARIGYSNVDYLGHVVGSGDTCPNPSKIVAIKEAKPPHTKKQVRSFLGLAGFYRQYVPNFAEVATPLSELTQKGQPDRVIWGNPQEAAFNKLKSILTKAPILKLPVLDKAFILQTDASDVGVGAALLQEHDGCLHPVAFASKKLVSRECRYSTVEREALGIFFGITKFGQYLYGREFVLQTDHEPLQYLYRNQGSNNRILRWALALQGYRFRVEAIKGSTNVTADYLSRSTE